VVIEVQEEEPKEIEAWDKVLNELLGEVPLDSDDDPSDAELKKEVLKNISAWVRYTKNINWHMLFKDCPGCAGIPKVNFDQTNTLHNNPSILQHKPKTLNTVVTEVQSDPP
jgi:hypothetical protein